MAIQQGTQFFLTLKVLQFVQQLRRRLKPRVLGSLLGTETSLGSKSKTIQSIAKGLSRVGLQERKQTHHASDRSPKSKSLKPSLKLQTPGRRGSVHPNTCGEEVQRIFNSVDEKLSAPGSALSAVAADDGRFLKQNDHLFSFEACSLNETIRHLALVHDAISVFDACRSQYGDEWLIGEGQDMGLEIDEAFIANYEHLLMRLRAQLIETLSRKVLEALLLGAYTKTQRKLLAWFTEFPDNQPHLSTTMPWTIKPSLAVLWGVCWMFYNSPGGGGAAEESNSFLQSEQFPGWDAAHDGEYLDFGGAPLVGAQSQPAAQQQAGRDDGGVDVSFRNLGYGRPGDSFVSARPGQGRTSRAAAAPLYANNASDQLQADPDAYTRPSTYDPFAYYLPDDARASSTFFFSRESLLPGNPGHATRDLRAFPVQDSLNDPWQQHQIPYSSLPQRATRHPLTTAPAIRVNGAADTEGFAPPQPDFFNILYQPGAQEPEAAQLNLNTDFSNLQPSPYIMGNCPPPENSPILPQIVRHERTSSVNSISNILTPVSMSAPRSPLLSPARDRRPSVTSSHGHIRPASEDGSSQDDTDIGSLPRNHAYKRSEEPSRNSDNKMICKYKECIGSVFDRKCEWSKHMDKHDRPYKCNVKGCEKLQGFTYSGGLLRHEREVHKLHGGTKKSLYCPHPDCKRSSGSGFTRKENLAEHVRRVHRRTSTSSDLGNLVIPGSNTQDDTNTTDVRVASDSPYQRMADMHEEDSQYPLKRKRSNAGLSDTGDDTDLRAEVKRLRKECEEKDIRLQQLEAAVVALQQQGPR
ncbi:hypothetical protein BDV95DRAFT_489802 [Massariosphaeria phaeospora]|uniref:C2H2-type domain-containing protein n=1 Tax=Massariosphaeria phaeospora TaxID=100035 RepID=A0A7C8MET0_9PLEO|nr:hypothetical protein BDV95DRAFT_489802 [Massariosphaeria phaeospora]